MLKRLGRLTRQALLPRKIMTPIWVFQYVKGLLTGGPYHKNPFTRALYSGALIFFLEISIWPSDDPTTLQQGSLKVPDKPERP